MATTAQIEKLHRAFNIVAPKGAGRDWKDPIDHRGSAAAFAYVERELGISLEDIREAVIHYTATVPTIERRKVDGVEMVFIKADGYRRGPAGDR